MANRSSRFFRCTCAGIALVFASHTLLAQGTGSSQKSKAPADPPRKAKKVWTNEDIAGASKTTAPASTACAADPQSRRTGRSMMGRKTTFSAAEQRALEFVAAIAFMERSCQDGLDRPCSLDELVKTVRRAKGTFQGHVIGLAQDPRADSNYQYDVTISGSSWEITATPRSPGLGGFRADSTGLHFNPKGPATMSDAQPDYDLELKALFCDPNPKIPAK